MTGFYRDGCGATEPEDLGSYTVCSIMTPEFLEFSLLAGNDLSTPRPEWGFPGLSPGDRWCVCASRWLEAYRAGLCHGTGAGDERRPVASVSRTSAKHRVCVQRFLGRRSAGY